MNSQQVVVQAFGGVEQLQLQQQQPVPTPGKGQVCVRLTSIGMNHADLMARRGEYKASSGSPPFTPGIEAGGYIHEIGEAVDSLEVGQRVVLGMNMPRAIDGAHGGTYRSHMIVDQADAWPAPEALPDDQLGAVILPYLTAWGCLVWKQQLQPGQIVAIPAASSSVSLAAAQIAKQTGATVIGMTSDASKVEAINALPTSMYDHLVVTHVQSQGNRQMLDWRKDIKQLTAGHGVDVFFDPIASGTFLEQEIRALAKGGVIYVYGLLGVPDRVDVSPLILKGGRIEGWLLNHLADAPASVMKQAWQATHDGFNSGAYRQHVAKRFSLENVREAHKYMEQSRHIGKLVLIPELTEEDGTSHDAR